MAVDAVGTGPTGVTNGAIGSGVIAFRMEVVSTAVGALDGTIRIQIGAQHGLGGLGLSIEATGAPFLLSPTIPSGAP